MSPAIEKKKARWRVEGLASGCCRIGYSATEFLHSMSLYMKASIFLNISESEFQYVYDQVSAQVERHVERLVGI